MRFSTIFVAALSSAGIALATTSKNGIVQNGAFACEFAEPLHFSHLLIC
jgi:hypothetical protein